MASPEDKAVTIAAVDNVTAQILEHEAGIQKARINITNLREAIRTEQEAIRLRQEAQRVLRRRKRVFATAKHQLEMIDEGL